MNSGKMLFGMIFALIALSSFGFAVNYTINLVASPSAGGIVSPTSQSNIPYGANVSINASPNSGYNFTGWNVQGACYIWNVYAKSTKVTVYGNCNLAANFTLTTYSLNVVSAGNGTVSPAWTYNLVRGSIVNIYAIPNANYKFSYWQVVSGGCAVGNLTSSSTYANMSSANCIVKAWFAAAPQPNYTLSVNASPANGGSVSGSASGLANGSVRAISATPNSGWSFSQWTKAGACSIWNASARNTSVTVNGDCQITATFAAAPQPTTYSLNVYPSPLNSGYVTGSTAGLAYGSVRSISAAPYSGYRFDYWVGNCPIANQYAKNTSVNITPSNGTVCNTYAYTTYTGINQTNTTNKPDLTIPSLKLNGTAYVNKRAHGSVETKNIGNGTAGNSTTSYYINGALVNSVAVPQLAPGASSTGAITFICTRVGTYTLSAKADSTGILNESREDNNAKNLTFNCVRPLKAGLSQPAGQVTQKTQTFASITDSAGKIWSGLSYLLGFGQR